MDFQLALEAYECVVLRNESEVSRARPLRVCVVRPGPDDVSRFRLLAVHGLDSESKVRELMGIHAGDPRPNSNQSRSNRDADARDTPLTLWLFSDRLMNTAVFGTQLLVPVFDQ